MGQSCYRYHNFSANCNCDNMASVSNEIVFNSGKILAKALADMNAANALPKQSWSCESPNGDNDTRTAFDDAVEKTIKDESTYLFKRDKYDAPLITAPVKIEVTTRNTSSDTTVGWWNPAERFKQSPSYKPGKIRRFFRVGKKLLGTGNNYDT